MWAMHYVYMILFIFKTREVNAPWIFKNKKKAIKNVKFAYKRDSLDTKHILKCDFILSKLYSNIKFWHIARTLILYNNHLP